MIQPSVENVIDRKGGVDGEKAGSMDSFPVEQADGADQRELERPSGLTDGASRSMGRGGDKYYTTRERWGNIGGAYNIGCNDWVEQADGFNRRDRPTGFTDGASRSMGRGGGTTRFRGEKKGKG